MPGTDLVVWSLGRTDQPAGRELEIRPFRDSPRQVCPAIVSSGPSGLVEKPTRLPVESAAPPRKKTSVWYALKRHGLRAGRHAPIRRPFAERRRLNPRPKRR